MKPCIGCKHLVARGVACKADEQLTRVEDAMTGTVRYMDIRYPDDGGFRPFPKDMRVEGGRCGPERKLYEPTLSRRLFPWLYEGG